MNGGGDRKVRRSSFRMLTSIGGEEMGCVFKRGDVYWIKYYRAGKPYRESSHSVKENEAKRLLKLREGQIAENRFPG